jgi:hypothetical protein
VGMVRLFTAVGGAVINDELEGNLGSKHILHCQDANPIFSMSVCEYVAPNIIPLLDIVRPLHHVSDPF